MRFLLLLLGFVVASDAIACRLARKEQSVPPQELISRTKNIVLAKAVRAEVFSEHRVEYTFTKITAISGSSEQAFTLAGEPLLFGAQSNTFSDHSDPVFWSHGNWGRANAGTDCEIHAAFSVGATYLLFLDEPYHHKSFEQIYRIDGDKKDKWLQYVEDRVRR